MRFSFRTDDASTVAAAEADLCVVATFETEVETPVVRTLDAALQGVLSKLIEEEQFAGKKSQSLMLHTHGKLGSRRVLLLGVGKRRDFVASDVRTWAARATRAATSSRCVRLLLVLPDGSELGFGDGLAALTGQFVVEGALLSTYQFDKYLAGERKKRSVVAPKMAQAIASAMKGPSWPIGGSLAFRVSMRGSSRAMQRLTGARCAPRPAIGSGDRPGGPGQVLTSCPSTGPCRS